MKPHSKWANVFLVILFPGYTLIRTSGLTTSCLWFDEIFSVHAAEHSWNSLLPFIALDLIHPPLFYVLLKLWISVGGESLFWLRLLPVSFAVASLIPFIFFLREMKQNRLVEILAIFLLTVNGSLIKYAQEVRMYSALLCFSLFSMWLFARYFLQGRNFAYLVLVNLVLIYTHYFGWFVVLTELFALLVFQPLKRRRALEMFTLCLVSFTPWMYAVWSAAKSGSDLAQNIGWMKRPSFNEIVQFFLDLIEPFYYQATNIDAASIYRISVPLIVLAVTVIVISGISLDPRRENNSQMLKLLLPFIALPMTLALIASCLLPYSIWGTRHLVIVFAPFCILLSMATASISISYVRTAAITLIVLFSGYGFVLAMQQATPQLSMCKFEPLIHRAMTSDGQRIYVFEDDVAYHIWSDLKNNGFSSSEVIKVNNVKDVPEDTAYFLPRGFGEVRKIDIADITDSNIWIAYRSRQFDETAAPLKTFLDGGYQIVDKQILPARLENAVLVLLEK